ncbi:MAG: peptide-N4-asparagine amidase [Janthinobacterium lividum]
MYLRSAMLLSMLSVLAMPAFGQVVLAPATPVIGSSNPVSPEPPVPKPGTTPCAVPILTNVAFNDYGTRPITFAPPASCPGPWAKVVLTADFTVTAGRQYDRTAKFFLGGANIYFGTTAEPRAALSPSWHIERDLTDYSALFTAPQTGLAYIQNVVNSTYTGVIYASATLLFYPANADTPAPVVPSEVLSLTPNNTYSLNTTTDAQSATFTLPRNVERAYLDVISQSQGNDEFWYTCVPNDVADILENCGNTGFRETEVAIDGQPAGVAPVYPWIYTGGIDPYLWEPIPGVETLNFKPYRVDLTPFAGVLSDGNPHTVSVSVFNADSRFDEASNLLLYTDPGASTVTGGVSTDTLTAEPSPNVQHYLNVGGDGTVSGPVTVTSSRAWMISGYVDTSHGRVSTTIEANNDFRNIQDETVYTNGPTFASIIFKQNVQQETTQQELTTTVSPAGEVQTLHNVDYPLDVYTNESPESNSNGLFVASAVTQGKIEQLRSPFGANSPNPVVTSESISTSDTLHYNSDASVLLSHDNNAATSSYGAKDAEHNCVYRELDAQNLKLTGFEDSTSCSLAP